MNKFIAVAVLLSVSATVSAQLFRPPAAEQKSAYDIVQEKNELYMQLVAEGEAQKLGEIFYTDDCVNADEKGVTHGREEWIAWMQSVMDRGLKHVKMGIISAEYMAGMPDFIIEQSTFEHEVAKGHYYAVWERTEDGWRKKLAESRNSV